MAVTFDSSATAASGFPGSATSGSTSATHRVSPTAPNVYAVVAVYWSGTVNASGASFSVSFGGHAMTPVTSGQVLWNSNEGTVILYYLATPPTGAQTVTASFSGMGTEAGTRFLALASATYSGVSSIGTAATTQGSSTQVTVPSATGQMVVNAFGTFAASGAAFTGYSGTSRVNMPTLNNSNQGLLLGDATGASLVTLSATASASSQNWGGIGVALVGTLVSYDATGAGSAGWTETLSWSHTLGASATGLVVAVSVDSYFAATGPNITVTQGSTRLTQLGVVNFTPGSQAVYLFGLVNPATGTKTITVTSSAYTFMAAASVSYNGVAAFGQPVTSSANSSTVFANSTTPANRVVAAHGVTPIPNVFSYNQTKRAVAIDPYTSAFQFMVMGDAPGDSLVTSTATFTNVTSNWGAVAVNLTPAPVMLNASALIGPILTGSRISDYRNHTPSPIRTYLVPATGVQPVLANGRLGPQWTQANDSVLDYTFDWTNWLESTSDTIANVTFTPSDPAIQVISTNVNGAIATGWLTGGITGDVYSIVVHITTIDGRQDDRTFTLIISQT